MTTTPPLEENGHKFVPGAQLGFKGSALSQALCCRTCGVVRNRDGSNSQCRGAVKVELR